MSGLKLAMLVAQGGLYEPAAALLVSICVNMGGDAKLQKAVLVLSTLNQRQRQRAQLSSAQLRPTEGLATFAPAVAQENS